MCRACSLKTQSTGDDWGRLRHGTACRQGHITGASVETGDGRMEPVRTSRDAADHDAIAIAESEAARGGLGREGIHIIAGLRDIDARVCGQRERIGRQSAAGLRDGAGVVIRNVPVPTLTSAASVVPPDPLTSPT